MKKIVIATKNKGKVREMREALSHLPVEVVSLAEFGALPDAVEDGKTFAENARIKAAFYQQQTGCACLADDSGLEVEVLGGKPGIFSARFAGFHADDATNNEKLLAELRKAGVESSPADYRCALAFVDVDGTSLVTEGRCDGTVRMVAKGRTDSVTTRTSTPKTTRAARWLRSALRRRTRSVTAARRCARWSRSWRSA